MASPNPSACVPALAPLLGLRCGQTAWQMAQRVTPSKKMNLTTNKISQRYRMPRHRTMVDVMVLAHTAPVMIRKCHMILFMFSLSPSSRVVDVRAMNT